MSNKDNFLKLLSEEKDLASESFSDLIEGDIKPIVQDKIEKTSEVMEKDLAKIRQEAATRKSEDVTDSASSGFVHMVQPNDVLEYRKPGIQPGVHRRLHRPEQDAGPEQLLYSFQAFDSVYGFPDCGYGGQYYGYVQLLRRQNPVQH